MTTMPDQPTQAEIDTLRTRIEDALKTQTAAVQATQQLLTDTEALISRLDAAASGQGKIGTELGALADRLRQQLPSVGAVVATSLSSCEARDHKHSALVIDMWKQTVTVQQHFNDLQLRIRNFAITVFGAVIGATAFALKENLHLAVGGFDASLASTILLAGALSWLAFYFMDRWWYHMLLVGAVLQGIALEEELQAHFPNASLTSTIGRNSPIRYGFAVTLPIAIAGACGVYLLAPTAGVSLANVLLAVLVLLPLLSIVSISVLKNDKKLSKDKDLRRRQETLRKTPVRIGLVVGLLIFSSPILFLSPQLNALERILYAGAVATVFIWIHEFAGIWMMHSRHKVDVFYFAGLLVYLGIAVCMQSTTRSSSPPSVLTETKTTATTSASAGTTTTVETTTVRTTTQP
jgi:hypothetical protein